MNKYEWNKYRRHQDENEPVKQTQCKGRDCYRFFPDDEIDVDGLCLECHEDELQAKIKGIVE